MLHQLITQWVSFTGRICIFSETSHIIQSATTLVFLDHLGVFVFAVSGALLAHRKGMDIFGFVVMALIPAVGGGTLRDLILDAPVFWVSEPDYLLVALAAAVLTFAAHHHVTRAAKVLLWFDAVGLSVFCVMGTAKALLITNEPGVAIVMGVITAVAGGIARDVVANDIPLILQRELYATAAIAGAITYAILSVWHVTAASWAGIAVALGIRALSILRGLSLPHTKSEPHTESERSD